MKIKELQTALLEAVEKKGNKMPGKTESHSHPLEGSVIGNKVESRHAE
jgi:hypothetical protein